MQKFTVFLFTLRWAREFLAEFSDLRPEAVVTYGELGSKREIMQKFTVQLFESRLGDANPTLSENLNKVHYELLLSYWNLGKVQNESRGIGN